MTEDTNAVIHSKLIITKHTRKLFAPPIKIIIIPMIPPDDICNAPATPVAVPELFPVADTAPIMQLATVNPFPRPNSITGTAIYKGFKKSFKCIKSILRYEMAERADPIIISFSSPKIDA